MFIGINFTFEQNYRGTAAGIIDDCDVRKFPVD